MSRAIVIGPVGQLSGPSGRWLRKTVQDLKMDRTDVIVAVDGGLDLALKLKLEPAIAVGDWDSLKGRSALKRVQHVTLPKNKDRSDLCFGLQAALMAKPTELICLGVTGGRPDHQLAVIYELAAVALGFPGSKNLARLTALGPDAEYLFLSSKLPRVTLTRPPGTVFSVFALGDNASGVSVRGACFDLRNATLRPSSLGLSNEMKLGQVHVSVRVGSLLVVIPRLG